MSSRARLIICALVASLAALPAIPTADAKVAIERYDGARPADAGPVIRKFEQFLLKYGTSIAGGERWRGLRRLSGGQDDAVTAKMIAEKLDQANRKWRRTDNAGAKLDLEQALAWIQDDQETATRIASLPELLTRAYVTLAMIAADAGDKSAATAWMVRLTTAIPDRPAIRTKFGPDAEKLYNDALKTARALDHGKLSVRVTNPRARIFINEIERGSEGVFEGELPTADYRVFVVADGRGYRFDRATSSGSTVELEIDWEFHRAFVASRTWVGLVIPPGWKDREAAYLRAAAYWLGSTTYQLLTVRTEGTQRYLDGQVFIDGRGIHRSGTIVLDDSREDARMEALAAFLELGTPSPLVMDGSGATTALEQPRSQLSSAPRWNIPTYTITAWGVGGALFAVGAGIAAADLDGEADCIVFQCRGEYGIPMAVVGLGVYVSGFLWWRHLDKRDRDRASRRAVFLTPTNDGAMAGVGGRF